MSLALCGLQDWNIHYFSKRCKFTNPQFISLRDLALFALHVLTLTRNEAKFNPIFCTYSVIGWQCIYFEKFALPPPPLPLDAATLLAALLSPVWSKEPSHVEQLCSNHVCKIWLNKSFFCTGFEDVRWHADQNLQGCCTRRLWEIAQQCL